MVRNLFIIASIFLAIVYVESGAQATRHNGNLPVVTVGFVIDGPWSNNDEIASIFQKEILDITIGEYDIRFPEDKSIVADWTVDGIESAFEQMLNDNEVDIVLTLGVIASHQAVKRDRLPKPVFAPFIVDAHMQNVPSKDGTSGIKNLNYLTAISNIANDLEIFLEIVPFENIVFLINKPFWESLHECKSEMHGAEHLGLTFTQIPVSESAEEALKAIPENTEAVYLGVLPLLGQSEYEKLIAGLIKKRLPNFALTGIMDVERGAMAGVMTRQLFIRRARRIALNIQR
ncbi:MAG: hypothetical protein GY839_12565, partial [candidate division Zixibacteria bacterium]|nr:hypothetical protein [candidate division Zixibacteria bacterium]